MHTLPDKLNHVQRTVEASTSRQLVDLRLSLERQIKEVADRAEESAVKRSQEHHDPQIKTLEQRFDEAIDPIKQRIEQVFADCQRATAIVASSLAQQSEVLHVEMTGLTVEFPPLRAHITKHHERLLDLEPAIPELRSAIGVVRADLQGHARELHEKIGVESLRADTANTAVSDRVESHATVHREAVEAAHEHSRKHASNSMQHTSAAEDRLLRRLDELSRSVSDDCKQHAAALTDSLRPDIARAQETMFQRVEDSRDGSEAVAAHREKQLREDLQAIAREVAAAAERSLETRAAELSAAATGGIEALRCDVASGSQAADRSLQEAVGRLSASIGDVQDMVEAKHRDAWSAIHTADKRAMEAATWAEQCAQRVAERHGTFEDTAAAIRHEAAKTKEEQQHIDIRLMETAHANLTRTRCEFEQAIKDCGSHCTSASEALVQNTAQQLRSETDRRAEELQRNLDRSNSAFIDGIAREATLRSAALEDCDQKHERQVREATVELQASLGSVSADLRIRVEGAVHHSEAVGEQAQRLQKSLAVHVESQKEVDEQLRADVQRARREIERTAAEAQVMLDRVHAQVEAHLEREVATLQDALARETAEKNEVTAALRANLETRATRREVSEGSAVVMSVAGSSATRINALEQAHERARALFEKESRGLADLHEEALVKATDTRSRLQRETTALGTELVSLRAAATSLSQGTLQALRVLGLLEPDHNEGARDRADVSELLEWEKSGRPLAARVAQRWRPDALGGAPNVLAMIDRKANEADLRTMRASLNGALRLPGPSGPSWPPSPAANVTKLSYDDHKFGPFAETPHAPFADGLTRPGPPPGERFNAAPPLYAPLPPVVTPRGRSTAG